MPTDDKRVVENKSTSGSIVWVYFEDRNQGEKLSHICMFDYRGITLVVGRHNVTFRNHLETFQI